MARLVQDGAEREAEGTAQHGEEQRLDEELCRNVATGRAESASQSDF